MLEEVDDVCLSEYLIVTQRVHSLIYLFSFLFLRVAASHSRCDRPDLVSHYTYIHRRSLILSLSYAPLRM
jgi:hypothetical protein